MSSVEVGELVATARAVAAASVGDLPDSQVADELLALRALADAAEAAFLSRLAVFDARRLGESEGLSTRAWLRHHARVAPGETGRSLRIAKGLRSLPVVADALAAGLIRVPHAAAIVDGASLLGVDVVAGCQDALVDAARVDEPSRLRAGLRGLGAAVDDKRAVREAERRDEGRWLDVNTTFDGAVHLAGVLGAEDGAIVKAAIDALAAPGAMSGPTHATGNGATGSHATGSDVTGSHVTGSDVTGNDAGAAGTAGTAGESGAAGAAGTAGTAGTAGAAGTAGESGADGIGAARAGRGGDTRTAGQRRADALVELCRRHLDSGALPTSGGQAPHVVVVTDLATLEERTGGFGELPDGNILTGDAVRRLACEAGITRVITDSQSQPLDVGRAQRTATTAQRRALRIRDGDQCLFPGCDRPGAWTQAHHVNWWSHGGHTAVDEMVLLCKRHHTSVHEGGWHIRIIAPGRFIFINPTGHEIPATPVPTTRDLITRLVEATTIAPARAGPHHEGTRDESDVSDRDEWGRADQDGWYESDRGEGDEPDQVEGDEPDQVEGDEPDQSQNAWDEPEHERRDQPDQAHRDAA